MCQGQPDLIEAQLGLRQLQAFAGLVGQATRQWRDQLEHGGEPAGGLYLRKALSHARKLEEALRQAEQSLAARAATCAPEATVTTLLQPHPQPR